MLVLNRTLAVIQFVWYTLYVPLSLSLSLSVATSLTNIDISTSTSQPVTASLSDSTPLVSLKILGSQLLSSPALQQYIPAQWHTQIPSLNSIAVEFANMIVLSKR
eukprot:TRINITY_DN2082_c0_g1_i4.p1 TRINITY_DN2082_c0_g1~~TRINITY_DN2082_c0_g1_i4.p1  ORF type:complete len:105 (+),score=12.89 TRINITY_DN2082_c0_g1_i4:166-480(+)